MNRLFIIVTVLLVSVLLLALFGTGSMENWQDYNLAPYNYILSGRDPLYFYRYDRYRRPYRDGFLFYQSYPVPHMRPHN